MKALLLGVFFTLLFASCEQVAQFTQFDIPYNTEFTIPATGLVPIPIDLTSPAIETNIEQRFKNFNTSAALIEKITLKSLKVSIVSPVGEDFSFLENATLYIDADGLDEIKIASKDPVPTTGDVLEFDVTGVDLEDYIKSESFTLRLRAAMDETLSVDHKVKSEMVFNVDAKILGV